MNELLTLICDAIEHMNIGGFTKLRELEPELKRQYDVCLLYTSDAADD